MNAIRPKNQNGFTIVETLIVLAVAGLILMIVLLAVPALQRNSRNSQRKQDVQAVLDAISQYELNHSGNFIDCGQGGHPSCNGSGHLLQFAHLTYYRDSGQVEVRSLQPNATAPAPSNQETMYVYNHQKCNLGGNGPTPKGAGYGDIAALYAIETSNNVAWHCQQL